MIESALGDGWAQGIGRDFQKTVNAVEKVTAIEEAADKVIELLAAVQEVGAVNGKANGEFGVLIAGSPQDLEAQFFGGVVFGMAVQPFPDGGALP